MALPSNAAAANPAAPSKPKASCMAPQNVQCAWSRVGLTPMAVACAARKPKRAASDFLYV
eukprot:6503360-Prymnesium_polylepis.1